MVKIETDSNQLSVISDQSAADESMALRAEAVRQRAEIRDQSSEQTPEISESQFDWQAQDAGNEMVTCVEKSIYGSMARWNKGLVMRNRRGRAPTETEAEDAPTELGDSLGRLTWACGKPPRPSAVPPAGPRRVDCTHTASGEEGMTPAGVKREFEKVKIETGTGLSDQSSVVSHQSAAGESVALGADAGSSGSRYEMGSSELPESPGDFVPQTAGDELVMREDCPEIHWENAKGSRLNAKVRNHEDLTGSASAGGGGKAPPGVKRECRMVKIETSKATPCTQSASGGEDSQTGRPGDRDRRAGASVCSATELAGNGGGRGAGETPEIPESGRQVKSQAIYDEGVMCEKNTEIQAPPRVKRECRMLKIETGTGQRNQSSVICDQSAADESVALRADAGSSGGRYEMGSSELPESMCDFVPQTAGGKSLRREDCPEFVGGDDRRGGGVKAVEDDRSPSPGGTVERPELDEHSWGFRRGLSELGDDLARVSEIPESECGFVLHDADDQWVMRQECPEFRGSGGGRGGGVKAVEDDRSPSPGGQGSTLHPPRHRQKWHPRGFRGGLRAAGGDLAVVSEIPESSLASSAEIADG